MAISNLFGNFSSFMKGINLRKFKTLSRLCAEDPSNAYQILKKEFFQQMREVAIRQIHKENKDIINGIPDITYGLYKRPGTKRIDTSGLGSNGTAHGALKDVQPLGVVFFLTGSLVTKVCCI